MQNAKKKWHTTSKRRDRTIWKGHLSRKKKKLTLRTRALSRVPKIRVIQRKPKATYDLFARSSLYN